MNFFKIVKVRILTQAKRHITSRLTALTFFNTYKDETR